jgi:hypothetical protein
MLLRILKPRKTAPAPLRQLLGEQAALPIRAGKTDIFSIYLRSKLFYYFPLFVQTNM